VVPRLIHQIWIGPDPAPTNLIDTWRTTHPTWRHKLWTKAELDELSWRAGCRRVFDRYVAERCWHGAADVARVEILRVHGGVYLDADMLCLQPLDDAGFMAAGFWVSESPHAAGRPQNAAMGCAPAHPLIDAYSRALEQVRVLHPAWRRTGALLLQQLMKTSTNRGVVLVPSRAFHPYRLDGRANTAPYDGPVYGEHRFYSTRRGRTP
jgi:mannosyltransferase OCH1-like enzyme